MVFEFAQNDKWHIANESALRFLPGMRYLIFAYTDPASGRPRINTYQDFALPPRHRRLLDFRPVFHALRIPGHPIQRPGASEISALETPR